MTTVQGYAAISNDNSTGEPTQLPAAAATPVTADAFALSGPVALAC